MLIDNPWRLLVSEDEILGVGGGGSARRRKRGTGMGIWDFLEYKKVRYFQDIFCPFNVGEHEI